MTTPSALEKDRPSPTFIMPPMNQPSPRIREPLPWGIPLTPYIWISAALLLAVLPLALGVRGVRARDLPAPGAQVITGRDLLVDGKDATDRPLFLQAIGCQLSGAFPSTVSFRGRTLVLAPDFQVPVLDVRCAIIVGDRSGVGQLTGSYQALLP